MLREKTVGASLREHAGEAAFEPRIEHAFRISSVRRNPDRYNGNDMRFFPSID